MRIIADPFRDEVPTRSDGTVLSINLDPDDR
jgi:hypothetical protein